MKTIAAVVCVLLAAAAAAERPASLLSPASLASLPSLPSLAGSKVYNVFPETQEQFEALRDLELRLEGLDFWQRAHREGREARVLVPAAQQRAFAAVARQADLPYEVLIDDVEGVLARESEANDFLRKRDRRSGRIGFTSYHRHAEMNDYMDSLAVRFPRTVTVIDMGKSSQGRTLKAVKISSGGGGSKPLAIVDAGIHAREWIAPAQALYMISKLVEDVTEQDLVSDMDWLIIPLLNPDGYEYSHTDSRLWRKTRSTASSSICPGVDGNRNFDFKWMVSGSSSSACSDIFAGPEPFSEPETAQLRDLVMANRARTKLYLAVHSYGSYFLYPYGYDGSNPPNVAELKSVGTSVARAIDAAAPSGSKRYLVGNSAVALNYAASGASDDWAAGGAGVALSFTLELPGGGSAGFDLPPARIAQVVKETWAGLVVLARYVIANK